MFGLRVSNSHGADCCLLCCQGNPVVGYWIDDFSSLDHDGVAVVHENTKRPRDVVHKLRALAIMCVQEDVIARLESPRGSYASVEVPFVRRLCVF